MDPLATGLLMLPGGLVMGLLAPVVGRVYDPVSGEPDYNAFVRVERAGLPAQA